MDRDIKELTAILRAEKEVFVRYFEKLVEQQEYLIENNFQGVRKTVEQINSLAQEAVNLESGRRTVIDRISKKSGLDPKDISVSKLLEKFKGPMFEELDRLKTTILEINGKVNNQKNRNELLIAQSMGVIKQTIDFLNEANNPTVTYKNPALTRRGTADGGSLITRTG